MPRDGIQWRRSVDGRRELPLGGRARRVRPRGAGLVEGRVLGVGVWASRLRARQQGERVLRQRGIAESGVEWSGRIVLCLLRAFAQDNVVLHCAGQGNAQGYPSLA